MATARTDPTDPTDEVDPAPPEVNNELPPEPPPTEPPPTTDSETLTFMEDCARRIDRAEGFYDEAHPPED
jgi:hypothetical protein